MRNIGGERHDKARDQNDCVNRSHQHVAHEPRYQQNGSTVTERDVEKQNAARNQSRAHNHGGNDHESLDGV
jgi:hypothetical protein